MYNFQTLTLFGLAAGSALAIPFSYPKNRVPVVYEASTLTPRQASGLNTAAVNAGKLYFGTATELPSDDAAYTQELNNTADFGQLTPANSMKWDSTEPSQGQFSYAGGDTIAELADANGQKLRCHTLVWYNQLPSWVSNGGFDNATLIDVMTNHITEVVTHFRGQCYAWDVVNEAISDNGDGSLRSNVFLETIGEAYIPIAFAAAAAADPDAKLYYNDYSIEDGGAKSQAALEIVKLVQSYGVKIDGVGLQSHFIVGSTPSTEAQVANMQAFADLGVDVAITELDIRAATPISDANLQQQATDYASTVDACTSVEACVGITLWDYTDKYSWIPNTFSGEGAALPWGADLEKKPAYDAILEALQGAAGATPVATTSAGVSAIPTSVSSLPASEEGIMTIQTDTVVSNIAVATAASTPVVSNVAPPAYIPQTTEASSFSEAAPTETAAPSSEASISSLAAYSPPAAPEPSSSSEADAVAASSSSMPTGYASPTGGFTYTYSAGTGIVPSSTGAAMPTGTGVFPIYPNGTGAVAPVATGTGVPYPNPTADTSCVVEYVYV